MADTFQYKAPEAHVLPGDRWFAITPDDDNDLAITPRAIVCTADGSIAAIDALGVTMTVPMTAGNMLPIRPVRVGETTTGTFYGVY